MPDHKSKPLNPAVQQLIRKLECWELEHLRTLTAAQDSRIAALEQRIEQMQDELHNAWVISDMWRESAMQLTTDLRDEGFAIGITQDCQIGIIDERKAA